MAVRNTKVPDDRLIAFRIGVNLGDVIIDDDDIYGDGVNVAARLQEVARRRAVFTSRAPYSSTSTAKVDADLVDMGNQQLKNMAKPIRVYRVDLLDISSTAGQRPLFNMSSQKKGPITGGCSCGNVRFEISEPAIDVGYCHCRMCQRFSGAPVSAFAAFPSGAVRFTRGEPKYYDSSKVAQRGFCADCGSSLTYRPLIQEWSDWVVIQTGSLDHPEDFAPTWHSGIESQTPWLNVHDSLPRVRSQDQPDLVEAWASVDLPVPEPNLR